MKPKHKKNFSIFQYLSLIPILLKEAWFLMFCSRKKSFITFHKQNFNGTWPVSYVKHVRFKQGVRLFSLTFIFFLLTSLATVTVILQIIFPSYKTDFALAKIGRRAASTITVTNLNNSGVGSLRLALLTAAEGDTITFDSSLNGTISLTTSLVSITKKLTIDGSNANITLDGSSISSPLAVHGINCGAQITVRNLTIQNFPNNGIQAGANCANSTFEDITVKDNGDNGVTLFETTGVMLEGIIGIQNSGTGISVINSNTNTIQNSYIGTDANSTAGLGNVSNGIAVTNSTDTEISNSTVLNNAVGINMTSGSDNTTISGSTIKYNTSYGIAAEEADNLTITGSTIEDNADDGVYMKNSASGVLTANTIINNGLTQSATNPDVSAHGVSVDGGSVTVGASGSNNVIYGNIGDGINAISATVTILYNIIGTDANDTANIGNTSRGIFFQSIEVNPVSATITSNIISGNSQSGIYIGGAGATAVITANKIGTNSLAAAAIPNATVQSSVQEAGIILYDTSGTTIGGSTSGEGNIIAGNSGSGIYILGNDSSNTNHSIKNNFIGLSSAGLAIPNAVNGIWISGAVSNITIGDVGAGNTIAYHPSIGVYLGGDSASGVRIVGNSIFANEGAIEGVMVAEEERGIGWSGTVNDSIERPQISTCSDTEITGTSSVSDGTIHVYSTDGDNQGKNYLTQATVDSDGVWQISADFSAYETFVATVTNSNNSTSKFSLECEKIIEEEEEVTPEEEEEGAEELEEEEEPEVPSIISYLTAAYLKANGYIIFDEKEIIPVSRNEKLSIEGTKANDDHKLNIKLSAKVSGETQTISQSGNITPRNGKWHWQTTKKPEKDNVYTFKGRAVVDGTVTKYVTLAKVRGANPAPTITSLVTNNVIASTRIEDTIFKGLFYGNKGALFQLRKNNGEVVATCETSVNVSDTGPNNGGCKFSSKPVKGEYLMYFQTQDGDDDYSAADVATLVIADNTPTKIFYANSDDSRYFRRFTTNAKNTVMGIAPKDAEVRIFMDGSLVGTATRDGLKWSYEFDLTDKRGTHHFIARIFENKKMLKAINFTLAYVPNIVQPVITAPAKLAVDEEGEIVITCGLQNDLTVTIGEEEIETICDEDVDEKKILAKKYLTFTPPKAGITKISVTVMDANGLTATASKNIKVISPIITVPVVTPKTEEEKPGTVEPVSQEEEGGEVVKEKEETKPEKEEEPAEKEEQAPAKEEVEPEKITPTEKKEEAEEAEPIVIRDENMIPDEQVPQEWKEQPKTVEEVRTITGRLDESNAQVKVRAERIQKEKGVEKSVPITPGVNGESVLKVRRVVGLKPLSLPFFGTGEETSIVTFSGTAEPYALITITIRSNPIVKITRADEEGKWTLSVPMDMLPEGEHSAFLRSESKGVQSEEIEIAKFVVIQEDRISNTSWILIIQLIFGTVVLLVAVTFQLYKQRQRLEAQLVSTTPMGEINTTIDVTTDQFFSPSTDHEQPQDENNNRPRDIFEV